MAAVAGQQELKAEKNADRSSFLVVTKTQNEGGYQNSRAVESMNQDIQNWYEVRMVGKLPQRRSYHVMIDQLPSITRLIIAGGCDIREGPVNSVWAIDMKGMKFEQNKQVFNQSDFQWTLVKDSGEKPENLAHHKAVLHNGHMWIFGGNSNGVGNDSIYKLNLVTYQWSKLPEIKDGPQARDDHSLVWWSDQNGKAVMIVFGGFVDSGRENDLWQFDFDSAKWTQISPITKQTPCKRSGHSAVVYQDKMYVFGGVDDQINRLNDFWQFDLKKKTWSQIRIENAPNPRNGHSATLFHNYMIIFGGMHDLTKELNDLHAFDFHTKTWKRYLKENLTATEDKKSPYVTEERKSPGGQATMQKTGGKSPLLPASPMKTSLKSPMKTSGMSPSPRRKQAGASPKRLSDIFRFDREKQGVNEDVLQSPTSVTMQNSFLIQNADSSFDAYYNQHLKRKNKGASMRQDIHEPTFGYVQYKRPPARDGHFADIHDGLLVIMGGDRHHMPYNDIYLLNASSEILSITQQLKRQSNEL